MARTLRLRSVGVAVRERQPVTWTPSQTTGWGYAGLVLPVGMTGAEYDDII